MRLPSLAVAASAALLLTACGGDDDGGGDSPLAGRSATDVVTAAADALEESGAVHVQGAMSQDGAQAEIDMQLQGEDAAGSISMDGTELELVLVDGQQFLKAGADFWAASGVPQQVAASLDGRWVTVPGGSEDFADLTLAGIADSLRDPDSPVPDEVREDELDGQDVVVVQQEDGSELFVADDDPSYPLQITDADGGSGTLTFSGFGEEADISAPADAVDLEELAAG